MEQIHFNKKNEPYYSKNFITGFNHGAKRQYEKDMEELNRLMAELQAIRNSTSV